MVEGQVWNMKTKDLVFLYAYTASSTLSHISEKIPEIKYLT